MSNFYNYMESVDFKFLTKFNERTKIFNKIKANKLGSRIDVDALKKNNEFCKIELKTRDCNINTYDTIFIEVTKAEALQQTKIDAYYVNFFQTPDVVAIWNLKTIDLSKIEIKKNVRIWDKGAKKYKYEDRYLLPPRLAYIYIWDEKNNKYNIIKNE